MYIVLYFVRIAEPDGVGVPNVSRTLLHKVSQGEVWICPDSSTMMTRCRQH